MSFNPSGPEQYFQTQHYQRVEDAAQLPTPPETMASSCASLPPTPSEGALAGRKRSREDIYSDETENSHSTTHSSDWPLTGTSSILGDGPASMANASDLSSQACAPATAVPRPVMPTRKSQRLDTSTTGPSPAALAARDATIRTPGAEPLIEEATRLLGVSWTRMDRSETSLISQRAYTRWIARHYPALSDIEVWFENAAIPGYLGKATNAAGGVEEYYLWSYDLHQAILVTRNPGDLIFKLSQPHMSLSQAAEKMSADVEPVVEAAAANAAIVYNDRFVPDQSVPDPTVGSTMEID